jgi:hypothetical protein
MGIVATGGHECVLVNGQTNNDRHFCEVRNGWSANYLSIYLSMYLSVNLSGHLFESAPKLKQSVIIDFVVSFLPA